jgi:hypothetical protein
MLSLRMLALKAAFILTACGTESPTHPGPIVPALVASVTLSATELTIERGNTIQLTATPRDHAGTPLTGRTVTWHSSTPEVITITNGDRLTAVGTGTAFITATVEGKSAQVTVRVPEVTPAVAALVVPEDHVVIPLGIGKFLDALPVDAAGEVIPTIGVTWESLNTEIVTISAQGGVTTHRTGTTTVVARAGGLETPITVTVAPRPIPFP